MASFNNFELDTAQPTCYQTGLNYISINKSRRGRNSSLIFNRFLENSVNRGVYPLNKNKNFLYKNKLYNDMSVKGQSRRFAYYILHKSEYVNNPMGFYFDYNLKMFKTFQSCNYGIRWMEIYHKLVKRYIKRNKYNYKIYKKTNNSIKYDYQNSNIYNYFLEDEDPWEDIVDRFNALLAVSFYDGDDLSPEKILKKRKPNVPLPKWDKTNRIFQKTLVRERNLVLLKKLRERIKEMRDNKIKIVNNINITSSVDRRRNMYSLNYVYPKVYLTSSDRRVQEWARIKYVNVKSQSLVKHQMDGAHQQNQASVKCTDNGNVLFVDETSSSISRGKARLNRALLGMSKADPGYSMSHAASRELIIDTFEWKDDQPGTLLKSYVLPYAIYSMMKNSPNAVPFTMSTFLTSDITVKIRVNSNKFQVGMLQCSWLYDPAADKNIENRTNIFTLSQTNHSLVSAGSSNVAELHIPYISTYTALHTIQNAYSPDTMTLGKLYIYVLNKLSCPDTIAKSAQVTISVMLNNANFYGQKDISVGKHQMEAVGAAMAVSAAEKLLVNVTSGRDNPPLQNAKSPMVPQSNQSFCLGDEVVEPLNSLRLYASGQHKSYVEGPDEMSIKHVVQTYGLVQRLTWGTDQANGFLLGSWDASPAWDVNEYNGYKEKSDSFYYMPPVAVVSSLFAYWSGELKFKFDFISSQFHTGRILICYVPFYQEQITYEQARGYPHEVFDLRENQQLIFNVPYMSNVPVYHRRLGYVNQKDEFIPPGKVYMFIVNKLIPMDSVVKTIDINMYVAGGETFEVFVPAQPSVATNFFVADDTPSAKVQALAGSYPWYFGNDSIFVDNKSVEHVILRYGAYWNDLSVIGNMKENCYYTFDNDSKKANSTSSADFDQGTLLYKDLYYVPVDVSDGYGRIYMSACQTEAQAQKYFTDGWLGAGRQQCLTIKNLARTDMCVGNPTFIEHKAPTKNKIPNDEDFEHINIKHQSDERIVNTGNELETSNCRVYGTDMMMNKGIFGEKFDSLKVLCRRYQAYGVAKATRTTAYGDVLISIPIVPAGIDLNLVSASERKYYSKIRDGTIPVVLSGYRFFSGGIRMAVVVGNNTNTMWIQHRPDYEGPARINIAPDSKSAVSLINSGYAMYIQSTSVNNVLHFEVPYYKNRPLIYLQRLNPLAKQVIGAGHLGQVLLGCEGQGQNKDINLGFFYALADDAEAKVFQGFPPMLALQTIQQVNTIPAVRNYHQIDVNVKLPPEVTATIDQLNKNFSLLPDKMSNLTENSKLFLYDLFGHLGHVLITPSYKHITWGLIHLIIKFGLIDFTQVGKLEEKLFKFVKTTFKDETSQTEPINIVTDFAAKTFDAGFVKAQHQGPQKAQSNPLLMQIIEIASTLIILTSTMMSIQFPPKPRGIFRLVASFMKSLSKCSRDMRGLSEFFGSFVNLILKIFEFVGLYKKPEKLFENMMTAENVLLSEWFTECKMLCDVKNDINIFARDSIWSARLEECYVMGLTIGHHFIKYYESIDAEQKEVIKPAYHIYKDVFAELSAKRNDMFQRGYSAAGRREPFCVYLFGKPGCGKSVMAQSLIPFLLRETGISYRGEPIFTLASGSDYWNGCSHQPCVLIDDWLSIDTGTCKEQDLKAFTSLKSVATLNPPQAALPDKQQRYAPELMMVLSNKGWPEPVGTDKEVLWRRRDVLIECEMVPALKNFTNMKDEPKALLSEMARLNIDPSYPFFQHLRFRAFRNPSIANGRPTAWMTYKELTELLIERFLAFRSHQMTIYNNKKQEYDNIMSLEVETTPSLAIKRDEYRRSCEFLRTYTIKDTRDFYEIYKLASEFGRTGCITDEMGAKIVEIGVDFMEKKISAQHQCELDSDLPVNSCPLRFVEHAIEDNQLKPYEGDKTKIKNFFSYLMANVKPEIVLRTDAESLFLSLPKREHIIMDHILEFYNLGVNFKSINGRVSFEINDARFLIVFTRVDDDADGLIFKGLLCNCGQWLVACKRRSCWPLSELTSNQLKVPGYGCMCYKFDSSFYYSIDNKKFFKDDLVINWDGCDVPLCLFRSKQFKIKQAMRKSWILKNPQAVKMGNCPESFKEQPILDKKSIFERIIANFCVKFLGKGFDYLKQYLLAPIWNIIKGLRSVAAWLLLGTGVLCMILAFFTDSFKGKNIDNNYMQLGQSGDNARSKQMPTIKPNFVGVGKFEHHSGGHDNIALDHLKFKIKKNTFFLITPTNKQIRILFIHKNICVFLKHYHENFKDILFDHGWRAINCVSGKNYNINLQNWQFKFIESSSIGYAYTKGLGEHKSLLSMFADEQFFKRGMSHGLIVCPKIGELETMNVLPKLIEHIAIDAEGSMKSQVLETGYSYPWTAKGNCGSVLVSTTMNPCIVGVHVAGNESQGYAEPLCRSMFNDWIKVEEDVEFPQEVLDEEADLTEDNLPIKGEFIPIGRIHPKLAHHESGESREVPSEVHGKYFTVSTAPAPLKFGDMRVGKDYSPMYAGVEKMCSPPLPFLAEDILDAKNYFKQQLITLCKPTVTPVRSREIIEAIDGIPGFKFFDGIDMNTSEGFPLSCYRPKNASNKSWLFKRNENNETISIHKDLEALITREWNSRSIGVAVDTIFVDCLKDARLSLEKCKVPGKTRIFSISPVQYTIIFKMMFMDFFSAYRENRLNLNHAIGIRADGPEWGKLVRFMKQPFITNNGLSHFGTFFDGDYSNFGPSLAMDCMEAVVDNILEWCKFYYTDNCKQHERIRYCLMHELIHSKHLCFSLVYQTLCGAPSGSPITVEVNSMVNDMYLFISFKRILINNSYYFSADMFKNLVRYCTYGDDVIVNVEENIYKVFNLSSISHFLAGHNITFTTADKLFYANNIVYNNIEHISFLKRKFVKHPRHRMEYLAPLNLQYSVAEVMNWRSVKHQPKEGTLLSIEGCAANAYGHGAKMHAEIRQICNNALIFLGIHHHLRTFNEWDRIHFAAYYEEPSEPVQPILNQKTHLLELAQFNSDTFVKDFFSFLENNSDKSIDAKLGPLRSENINCEPCTSNENIIEVEVHPIPDTKPVNFQEVD